jgi:hypothetical protein
VIVMPGETPEGLAARVLKVEHVLYPAVLELVGRRILGEDFDEPKAFSQGIAEDTTPSLDFVRFILNLS